MDNSGKKKFHFHINIHVILISLIVILLGTSAFRLYSWNKGEQIYVDPNADTSQFDVEALDSIMPLPPAKQAGHTYDDELSILFLGDSNIASTPDKEDSFPNLVASLTDATVYNCAFPSSSLAAKNSNFTEADEPDDAFSLPYLAQAICSGDFSLQSSIAADYRSDGITSQTALQTLIDLDYNTIDVLCIAYSPRDYIEKRGVENPEDPYEICTYTGALRTAIEKFQATYPFIRIIVMSPYYVNVVGEDGTVIESGTTNFGHGALPHYLLKQIDVCTELAVSIVDNFYGTINQDNYQEYLHEGEYYCNEAGRKKLAERFTEALMKYPVGTSTGTPNSSN